MIVDVLENLPSYRSLVDGLGKAADFLARPDLGLAAAGRHEIDGEDVYAMVYRQVGRSQAGARLEAHRRYIDLQVVLAGIDHIGWRSVGHCVEADGDYIEERDVRFYRDEPDLWLSLKPGRFALFFAQDAHMPSISEAPIDKIVVKIALPDGRIWPLW